MFRSGNLFDRIVCFTNLWQAAHKAWRGKKDKTRIAHFYFALEVELLSLQEELQSGSWSPRPYRTFEVFEPKRRKIAAADFRDRVVHHAIMNLLEPVFERSLISRTFACRLGKGTHAAVRYAQDLGRRHAFFLKCDVQKYFESMDQSILKTLLRRHLKDARLLTLLDRIIDHAPPDHAPGKGVPIGNLTSQHFANLYLSELDHFVTDRLAVPGYVRYMDDFLFFGPSKSFLHGIHGEVRQFLADKLSLKLKESATLMAPVEQGMPFLGCCVFPGTVRLQPKGAARFRHKTREREQAFRHGQIDEGLLSLSVGSMIGHMAHADTRSLRQRLFSDSLGLG
ncbi:MAG: group II intron reverse transcriptase domain-containing protein [Magnetococcales bacterium]|nr:group II intron reverse transcriptase domain-containing protein [Magnetococcales bacterium]